MHEVDLVEDVAIAYGYDAVTPTLVRSLTVGQPRSVEELSGVARRTLAGLGLLEMKTLPLSSPEATYDALGLPRGDDYVSLSNPASVDQTMLRTSLLPGLLQALKSNIHRELPHRIFEVGDVTRLEPSAETGAHERRHLAVALVGVKVSIAETWSVVDALLRELGHSLVIREGDSGDEGLWIPGRVTKIRVGTANLEHLGVMGEVHPAVLERFGLRAPAALLELNLEALDGDLSVGSS
jgi:phenylalanyl-tRNA synthetase beta chain